MKMKNTLKSGVAIFGTIIVVTSGLGFIEKLVTGEPSRRCKAVTTLNSGIDTTANVLKFCVEGGGNNSARGMKVLNREIAQPISEIAGDTIGGAIDTVAGWMHKVANMARPDNGK